MLDKFLKIFPWILGVLVVVNLLLLDFIWVKSRPTTSPQPPAVSPSLAPPVTEACGASCLEKISQEVQKAISALPTAGVVKEKIIPPAPTSVEVKVIYIPLASSGSTAKREWTDIPPSDFYFDLADYSGAKKVRWEANLKTLHGASKAFARLYDVTNKRAVDFSELETQAEDFVLVRSSDLKIWQGNNLYRVQIKSLTGDEVYLQQARLKVILE